MDVFLFSLFIYLCAEYALQWEEQALVSALTKTRLQAGVSLWHGHRHYLAGCWLLCGSLCVVRQALQGKLGPVLFGHFFIFSCFTVWADRLSFPAGLVPYMCLFWNEPILSLWRCWLYISWSPSISGSFQPYSGQSSWSCCLAEAMGLGVSASCRSAQVLLPGDLPFICGAPPVIPPSVQMWN